MRAVTAKVFNHGRFQAIRLPKAFWVKSGAVKLAKIAGGFTVSEANPSARRLKAFLSLAGNCPDFPKIAGNTSQNIRCNWK
jgi:virulence-associated protein VagC